MKTRLYFIGDHKPDRRHRVLLREGLHLSVKSICVAAMRYSEEFSRKNSAKIKSILVLTTLGRTDMVTCVNFYP